MQKRGEELLLVPSLAIPDYLNGVGKTHILSLADTCNILVRPSRRGAEEPNCLFKQKVQLEPESVYLDNSCCRGIYLQRYDFLFDKPKQI